nr:hypothetical protein [Tanacetum cinerariifolium]
FCSNDISLDIIRETSNKLLNLIFIFGNHLGTQHESSSNSSFERSLDSSSPSAGPSRKRCRPPTTLVTSSTLISRSIPPALADLSPRKRFIYSYSFEVSRVEHMKIGTHDAKTIADLGISEGVRAHTEDEASAGGMMEIAVNPLATGDISEPTGGDDLDLEGTIYDIAHYMSEEEFGQVHRDRDDTQRRLRRLELLVERRSGFR